jgi:hypothetical protein
MGAAEGCHDDYLMATAILIYVCYKWQLPRIMREFRKSKKTRLSAKLLFKQQFSRCHLLEWRIVIVHFLHKIVIAGITSCGMPPMAC